MTENGSHLASKVTQVRRLFCSHWLRAYENASASEWPSFLAVKVSLTHCLHGSTQEQSGSDGETTLTKRTRYYGQPFYLTSDALFARFSRRSLVLWPVVVGTMPGLVGVIPLHALECLERIRPEIFFVNHAVWTDHESLHAGNAILCWCSSQREASDHRPFHYEIHFAGSSSPPEQRRNIRSPPRRRSIAKRLAHSSSLTGSDAPSFQMSFLRLSA
jgi:hypothetical protein